MMDLQVVFKSKRDCWLSRTTGHMPRSENPFISLYNPILPSCINASPSRQTHDCTSSIAFMPSFSRNFITLPGLTWTPLGDNSIDTVDSSKWLQSQIVRLTAHTGEFLVEQVELGFAGSIAQWLERWSRKPEVVSSILTGASVPSFESINPERQQPWVTSLSRWVCYSVDLLYSISKSVQTLN